MRSLIKLGFLQTGLTKSSKESKITEADAEQKVIDFLEGNGIKPGNNL
jgi:oligoribonuclease (3'-5' exoribonuclease)